MPLKSARKTISLSLVFLLSISFFPELVQAKNINITTLSTDTTTFAGPAIFSSDINLTGNKSFTVDGSANTAFLLGNYYGGTGFAYGTAPTASLAVEGDVKANRLCIQEDCKAAWSDIVAAGGGNQWTTTGSDIYNANSGNVGIGTNNPVEKLDINGGLNLTGRTYTYDGTTRTFQNVASYYAGSTPTTGTIVVTIGNTPNIMLDAEIDIQGYMGLTKCQVRGYTYTGSTSWHMPAATCLSSGHSGGYTVRFGKRTSDNARVIMIGTTSSNWGNYPHITIPRVTYGYPGSGSSIGDWSISVVTDESPYSSLVGVNVNSGFNAYNSSLGGITYLSGNVGIGTTSTSYNLDVNGTGNFTQPVTVGTPTASTHAATKNYVDSLIAGGSGSTVGYWTMSGTNVYNSNSGNIGIGTASPGQKLDVSGSIKLSGTIFGDADSSRNLVANNIYNTSVTGYQHTNGRVLISGNLNRINFSRESSYSTNYARVLSPGYYSVSFWYKVENYTSGTSVNVNLNDVSISNFDVSANKGWTYYSGTAYISNTSYGFLDMEGTFSSTITVSDMVISRSAKPATQYSPAPEDIVQINPNGNAGIGTANPLYKLDVQGTGNFTQPVIVGTPTASNQATTKSYVDSAVASVGGMPSGTTGQTLRYNSGWVADSNLYNNGTNVGIGTTSPGYPLVVKGIMASLETSGSNGTRAIIYADDNGAYYTMDGSTAKPIIFKTWTNGSETARIDVNGNIGINTTNPAAKLDVYGARTGTVDVTSAISKIGGGDVFIYSGALSGTPSYATWIQSMRSGDQASFPLALNPNGGNVGIGVANPVYRLDVNGTAQFTQPIIVGTPTASNQATTKSYVDSAVGSVASSNGQWITSANDIYNNNSGNVGIGISNPASKLHVVSPNFAMQVEPTSSVSLSLLKPSMTSGNNSLSIGKALSANNVANLRYTHIADGSASNYLGIGFWANDDILNVLASGNVGIGTTNPTAKLYVNGNQTLNVFKSTDTGTSGYAEGAYENNAGNRLIMGSIGSGYTGADWTGSTYIYNTGSGRDMYIKSQDRMDFFTGGTTLANRRMSILSNGNVGIGTTDPSSLLQVNGVASASRNNELGWTNFQTWYSYDGTTHYYWNRLYQLPTSGYVTFEVIAKTDINYPGFGTFTISASSYTGSTVSLSVIPTAYSSYNFGTVQAAIDASGYVWVKVPATWTSYVGFRTLEGGATKMSSITTQEADPSTFIVNATMSKRASFPALVESYSAQIAPYITTYGNTGIGSTNPSYTLDVAGTGQFTQPVIVGTPTASTQAATKGYVDSALGGYWAMSGTNIYNSNSGNIGIGTASPSTKLYVNGPATINGVAYVTTGVELSTGGPQYISYYGPQTNGYFQAMEQTGTSGYGTYGPVTSDWAMYNRFSGANTRGWIWQLATTNVAALSGQGHLQIAGNFNSQGTGSNYFAGNVGIGTTNPQAKLHVNGSLVLNRTAVADANYTVTSDDYIIGYTSLSAVRTVTIPASVCTAGKVLLIADESGSAGGSAYINIVPQSPSTIVGQASFALAQPYNSVPMYCNGTNWFIY